MKDLVNKLSAQWQDATNLILGLWLVLSPWPLAFAAEQTAAMNAWVCGGLIAVAAIAAYIAAKPWQHWLSAALGAWLIASPWALGFAALQLATYNAVAIGAVVVLLAVWSAVSESGGDLATG